MRRLWSRSPAIVPAGLMMVLAAAVLPAAAVAQPDPPRASRSSPRDGAAPLSVPARPPRLIVVISVDQFSADLFAEYRGHATGGFARLLQGGVFGSGYQSHAATETCPGHSTILTGKRPEHTGIIANNWIDQRVERADKTIYCAEDERIPGSSSSNYTVSDVHLKAATLGEIMKAADPRARVVSVAGKDRAAVMMGGHRVDALWWWNGKAFVSYADRAVPPVVMRANAATAALLAAPQGALDVPDWCASHDAPIVLGGGKTVGTGHFERAGGDAKGFRASPAFDAAVFALAAGLIQDMRLGRGDATDLIAIGASATDYVGHTYGTEGAEMCTQVSQLDRTMASFFAVLDAAQLDYEVVLTADHGGNDLPEREVANGMSGAARVDLDVAPAVIGKAIAAKLGIAGPVLLGDIPNGDVWISAALTRPQHRAVEVEAIARYRALPQVAAVLTRAEIMATPDPTAAPETWTLAQKARASFDPDRSGDLLVFLKPRITAIPNALAGYVATHGSPWDYDRRVPILFWRKGMPPFEHSGSIETVDIMPTLAHEIGVAPGDIDGVCRDLSNRGEPCQ